MSHRPALVVGIAVALLAGQQFGGDAARAPQAAAAGPKPLERREELVDRVRVAIQRGIQYLKDQENNTGNWDRGAISAPNMFPGGETSLALLALLYSGVPPTDPVIQRGLETLRKEKPQKTYVVALQTMVFANAGQVKDRPRIQENADWLINARVMDGDKLLGWTYRSGDRGPDFSNTQYALLGLHDAHQLGGAKIERKVWTGIRDLYLRIQNRDGGWGYRAEQGSILTMTTAGLCGLYIAGTELNERREIIRPDGTATNCGDYKENEALARGQAWLARHPNIIEFHNAVFYNLYGLERAGRLSGQRFLGGRDWYRDGCEFLVQKQREDGSYPNLGVHDSWPVVSTSLALLFLSKGRTPILISKFVHGPGNDWNNDRNDVRNLVDYASKELFKRVPLAWQVFDTTKTRMETRPQLLDTAADLLQSPILYLNGHEAIDFNSANDRELLKEYVNNGGFIFAEACCGKKAFADSFRAFVKDVFKDDLTPLNDEHPIWRAHTLIDASKCPYKLEGLQQGCKTVIVFSPQDLSCLWESNERESPRGQMAFRVGSNVIAYATGMELPKPRLTPVEIIRAGSKPVPRGVLKVAQIKHAGDWQPAPKAMRNLMVHIREKVGIDVALDTEAIYLRNADSVPDYKFLYMHGRADFRFTDVDYANLRANLQTGGLLFADACCGKKAFDRAFRDFAGKLFPGQKLERIPLSADLFSRELNGEAIKSVRCRIETPAGAVEKEFRDVPPHLEGIKIDGRWVVIYSKYDIGCALERHASSDCLGHDNASAVRLATAAVLYALKR